MDKAYEREKRYYQTEKGKLARAKANAKSGAKRYIKEFAISDDLEELKVLIEDKEKTLKNK